MPVYQRLMKLPKKPQIDKNISCKEKKNYSGKCPGSAKAHKTKTIPIHEMQVLKSSSPA